MMLSLGTVVEIEGTDSNNYKILIINRKTKNKLLNIESDYLGVVYPYGYMENAKVVYFNKEQVKNVLYDGYSDSIDQLMLDLLSHIEETND